MIYLYNSYIISGILGVYMNHLSNWAIQHTLGNGWSSHKFHQFLKLSTQSEFLKSQVPFFYAVQSFPRALARLASMIETNEHRLLVIENLSEEHGQGDPAKFHTTSFKTFLTALGWNGNLHTNPWVDEWISLILSRESTPSEYAAYLSGIEYAYAPISETITEHLKTLSLSCEQSHYSNHAELDWEHGNELLEVALMIGSDEKSIKEAFISGQNHFLELYNNIMIPTIEEIKKINNQPVSFYYTREDSKIEYNALDEVVKNKNENEAVDILMIASGGEHLIHYLSTVHPLNIDVFDMNQHQIDLCIEKIDKIKTKGVISNFQDGFSGKFEQVFLLLREYLGRRSINQLLSTRNGLGKKKLKFAMNIIFSNENLSFVFGDKATQYTKQSFSDHFYDVFVNALKNLDNSNYDNILNIIKGDDIPVNTYLAKLFIENNALHNYKFVNSSFENAEITRQYDIINVSNIGDWMPLQEYRELLVLLKDKLKPNGQLICRKLLGDYSLLDELTNSGLEPHVFNDLTLFYTETVIGVKNEN